MRSANVQAVALGPSHATHYGGGFEEGAGVARQGTQKQRRKYGPMAKKGTRGVRQLCVVLPKRTQPTQSISRRTRFFFRFTLGNIDVKWTAALTSHTRASKNTSQCDAMDREKPRRCEEVWYPNFAPSV